MKLYKNGLLLWIFCVYEFGVLHNAEHMRFQAFNLSLYAHVLSVKKAFYEGNVKYVLIFAS